MDANCEVVQAKYNSFSSPSSATATANNNSNGGIAKVNGNDYEEDSEDSFSTGEEEEEGSQDSEISSVSKTLYYTTVGDSGNNTKDANNDADDDDDEDEDEEEEDDNEQEPKLRYERLSSDLRTILSDDSASCICLHAKMMVLGTHWGRTHMLDAMGNSMPEMCTMDATSTHSVTVSQISIDHAGEFVASSSLDGRVMIRGLLTRETEYSATQGRTVKSVAIDPIYARAGSGKRFMTGDDSERVILHEKGLFNRYKQQVLGEGDGPVGLIRWRGRFAAWATAKGVRVYDVVEEKTVGLVKGGNATEEAPVRIAWSDQFHLYVSMGDCVRVCLVRKREKRETLLPEFLVEITASFTLEDAWVCGLAPLEETLLVMLTVPKVKNGEASQRPQLQVVEPMMDDFREVSTDLLSMRGHERYRPKDYHLDHLHEDGHFFVVSPKDVVLGRPRDADDHVEWLLHKGRFAEALDAAEENRKWLKRHVVVEVGRQYLDYLLGEADFKGAGELCVRIFGKSKKLWQEEVFKFARLKQLKALAPYLPREPRCTLEPQIYEMTLFEFLKTDPEGFLAAVRDWQPTLYSVSALVKPLVEQLLLNPDCEPLQRSLATLFSYQGKYDKAVAILLKLGHAEDVFGLIREHALFDVCQARVTDLMELDDKAAVKLFLEHMDRMPVKMVVSRLSGRHLFLYLDALVMSKHSEESKPYHGQLVSLYADFAKQKLLPFLRSSDHYPISEALEICRERNYTEEQIFILARIGDTKEALTLITDTLLDIHKAVDFCKEHDDADLWTDLIERSLDKPYFVNVLLHNIGTHVDPRQLVMRIETGQEIPGLRDSLVRIIHDYRLQVSLQEGCQRILVSDCYSLLQRQVKTQSRGLAVAKDAACPVCNRRIVDDNNPVDLVVFRCTHAFHLDCLPQQQPDLCALCFKSGGGGDART